MMWTREFSAMVAAMLTAPHHWKPSQDGRIRVLDHESGLISVQHTGMILARVVHSDNMMARLSHTDILDQLLEQFAFVETINEDEKATEVQDTLVDDMTDRYPNLEALTHRELERAKERAANTQPTEDAEDDDSDRD